MKQNKIYLMAVLFVCLVGLSACTPKKPPLEPTQIVGGQSIVMPPEFYVLPKAEVGDEQITDAKAE